MDYKKVISNQELRFKILHAMRFIPDKAMIKIQYRLKLGRKLNLNNPRRYTEKLNYYKLNYRCKLMTKCSDKYAVRDYVVSKGLSNILPNLYAVYNSVNEIETNLLPNKFAIKTTNGSGTNYFCNDKTEFKLEISKKKIANWLNRDVYSFGREWSYKNAKPKIIIEELLEDRSNKFDGINDYKFLCFNGQPKYIILDVERYTNHKRNIYDIDWNYMDVSTDHPNFGDVVPKPDGLNEMLQISRILSEGFPFVRVDLYYVNKKVYFGELTFYPWTGYVQFKPDEFDYILGDMFKL